MKFDWKRWVKRIYRISKHVIYDVRDNMTGIIIAILYLVIMGVCFKTLCPFSFLFGFPCPGCGLTRAGIALLRGDIRAALDYNPAIMAWGVMFLYWFCNRYVKRERKKTTVVLLIGVCVFTFGVYFYRLCQGTLPMVFQDSLMRKIMM